MDQDIDITKLEFTSLAAPTPEDDALWATLTPEQQRAYIDYALAEAQKGPFLTPEESRAFIESLIPQPRVIQA